jgi:hypothetical protein
VNLASGAVAVFSLCCNNVVKSCPEIGRTAEPKEGACEYAASDHKLFIPPIRLEFGTRERISYGEFDGRRRKPVLVKIIGE